MKLVPSFHTVSRAASAGIVSVLALSVISSTVAPAAALAASSTSSIQISGWIPYWAEAKGTADTDAHLSQVTEINPFGYSVKSDSTLSDTMNLSDPAWQNLFKDARAKGVKIVPTIMWSDTSAIYNTLSNPTLRAKHIQSIVNAVTQNGFDGVDIDYEGKSADTRDYYSAFLAELSAALNKASKNDVLDCTIEAREPLEARYSGTPPANIEYANDLPTVNKYCDRVRLMTYDQDTADLQLNAQHSNVLYDPVADPAWVEKVVDYMAQDISKSKMSIGVATYGYEYQAMTNPNGTGYQYSQIQAFNPAYATQLAQQYNITPTRGASGEMSFSFVPSTQSALLPSNSVLAALAPKGTDSANLAAVGALAYTKQQNKQAPVEYLVWSDAQAIQDKITLAKKLGVAGVAIFKFDGGEDPNMWSAIASVATPAPATAVNRSTAPLSGSTVTTSTGTTVTGATGSTTIPAGCMPGFAFSTQTGQACPVTTTAIIPPTTVVTPPVVTTPVTTTTSTSASTAAFTKDLQFGDSGTDVTRLQKILIAKGYMKVAANGNFGPATQAALTAWQKASGISATGYFGPLSRAAIVK